MCFLVDTNNPNVLIAAEDISCYKVVSQNKKKELISEYRYFLYHIDTLYKLDKPLKIRVCSIEEGYHSFTKLRAVKDNKRDDQIIIKCIIPQGSEYFLSNEYEEYVSTALIVKEILINKNKE
jgi:hypothetical protein